jgi:hypothetical protein
LRRNDRRHAITETAMDDISFDRLTKSLGVTATRRSALGLVTSALSGGFAGLLGLDMADARNKNKKKGKGKKKKGKSKPRGERCGAATCRPGQRCCGGECVAPDLCCQTTGDCNGCATCVGGVCVADPTKNGTQCSGCLECANGACGVPNDDFCDDGEICRSSTGICCPLCSNEQCCAVGERCINPGLLSPNFCCDAGLNEPCGDNGDGTYRECCSRRSERCHEGQCVPKDECPTGLAAEGLCCPDGRPPCPGKPGSDGPFCRPQQHESCCGDTSCNALQDCCDPDEGVCCTRGRCAEGRCCTGNREICAGKCCPFGQICCGSECCSEFGCVNGTCCEMDSCGAVDAANRICTGPNETCCRTGPDISGYACPSVEWGGACAADGRCCPEGTFYEDSCDKCCADVRDRCEDCLPTFAGRF